MVRKLTIPLMLLLTVVCGACIAVLQSSFSSTFSLEELVKRNQANSGLNCSGGGGGGAGSGIGAAGGGIGGTHSNFQKSESFACQISDADQFDEAKFIEALKQSLEKDLKTNDAEITSSKNTDASTFSIEYVLGTTSGRVDISGAKSAGYYSFNANVSEKTGT